MEGITGKSRATSFLVFVMTLGIMCVFDAVAHADTIMTCSSCHGMSPIDATHRNISTGGFVGNHMTHVPTPAGPDSCFKCHNNSGYGTSHRDRKKQYSVNINNSPAIGGGQYHVSGSPVIFNNQTSVPVLGSCTNVNCHFEAATEVWGVGSTSTYVALGANAVTCSKCHGAPPNDGSHPSTTGSGKKHGDYYTTGISSCVKCHSDHTAESNPFSHATSAGHRGLKLQFTAAPNSGGSYSKSANLAYPAYLPSQSPVRDGNCTSLYCHSPGTQASNPDPPNVTATWGGTLTCKGCHKSDYASGDAISSGSHNMHITGNYEPFGYNLMTCVKCHASTVTANLTITDVSRHVNGSVEIAFDSTSSAANGRYKGVLATKSSPMSQPAGITTGGVCTNVYCHSSGQGSNGTWPPVYQSPVWGNGATGRCGTCHGDQVSHGGFSLGNPLTSGSHAKHLQDGIIATNSSYERCVGCHAYQRTAFNPSGCNSNLCHPPVNSRHANYEINVNVPTNYGASANYNGTTKPGDGYSTCSNVSCHFNTTTPVWGSAISCFGCHTLAQLMASGSHSKHISNSLIPTMYNYTANRSSTSEYDFGCSNCHPLAASNHRNGTVNVTLKKDEAGVGALRAKNSATAAGIGIANSGITGTTKVSVVCLSSYCHSNGDAANLVYAATPDWYGGSFTGDRCGNCHGNSPNSSIAGSKSHYNNRFLGYTSNVGGHQIGIHAMNIYSSPGGLAKAGAGGASSHGNSQTSTTISCNICHFATVTSARNDGNPACSVCHVSGNTVGAQFGNPATIANRSKHVNGSVDVAFQPISIKSKAQMRQATFATAPYSSSWKRNVGYKVNGAFDSAKSALTTATMWNGTTKTCSNVACHNGQSVKWDDNNGATVCVSCHTSL